MTYRITQVDLFIDEEEKGLVAGSLDARWLTEGPNAKALQEALKAQTGARHVAFAPNGTLGLFLALLALDLPRGTEIVMPSFTFYGTATAAIFAGLTPVFVDVDPSTFNATPDAFAAAITSRTGAFMPVHIYGQACNAAGIAALAAKHGLKVVEDAAQALGVTLNGKAAGTFGDIGVYSLFSDKVITAGEGGVLLARDDELFEHIRLLRNQGRTDSGTFRHPALGMNFRITDLQAAIALAQLKKLPRILEDRARKWRQYSEGLREVGDLTFMAVLPGSSLVPFRFPILTDHREALAAHLEARGIQTRGFFLPMHLQPKLARSPPERLPVSESLHARGICLPIHYQLSEGDISYTVAAIRDFFGR